MEKRFEGKTAIVTGGAQGLGKEMVRLLLAEGANVVAADIEEKTLAAMAEELSGTGELSTVVVDITDPAKVQNMIDFTVQKYGSLDILFNNAGIMARGNFLEIGVDQLDRTYRVNVFGAFNVAQAAAKVMVQQPKKGVIVNTASMASDFVTPNTISYAATKGAVKQLTKVMAADLAERGIRVNGLAPGFMATRMIQGTLEDPERLQTILSKIPLNRAGQPAEMAKVALFLASDEASYMTGAHVLVDGGWSIY